MEYLASLGLIPGVLLTAAMTKTQLILTGVLKMHGIFPDAVFAFSALFRPLRLENSVFL